MKAQPRPQPACTPARTDSQASGARVASGVARRSCGPPGSFLAAPQLLRAGKPKLPVGLANRRFLPLAAKRQSPSRRALPRAQARLLVWHVRRHSRLRFRSQKHRLRTWKRCGMCASVWMSVSRDCVSPEWMASKPLAHPPDFSQWRSPRGGESVGAAGTGEERPMSLHCAQFALDRALVTDNATPLEH